VPESLRTTYPALAAVTRAEREAEPGLFG